MHAFSGCDSTSSFLRKRNTVPCKLMCSSQPSSDSILAVATTSLMTSYLQWNKSSARSMESGPHRLWMMFCTKSFIHVSTWNHTPGILLQKVNKSDHSCYYLGWMLVSWQEEPYNCKSGLCCNLLPHTVSANGWLCKRVHVYANELVPNVSSITGTACLQWMW